MKFNRYVLKILYLRNKSPTFISYKSKVLLLKIIRKNKIKTKIHLIKD